MIWLLLSIISATGIYVCFKFIERTGTKLINPIVINYLIAAIAGFWMNGSVPVNQIISADWLLLGLFQGVLLIVLFFFVGFSSRKAGISVTTVSAKMAVVIPMLFSIIFFKEQAGLLKYISIILAVTAVGLSVYKKQSGTTKASALAVVFPIILFFGMGLENSILIYAKEKFINESVSALFSATLFSVALLSGIILMLFKPSVFKGFAKPKTLVLGAILGLFNYGSIYFMLMTLNSGVFSNAVSYGIVNVGIVALTVLTGTVFFKEKLSKLNIVGVSLALITFVILTFA
jgi:drug/metabolite transporter (DMT)-like permease